MKTHLGPLVAGLALAALFGSTVSASTIRTRSAVYGDLASRRVCDATPAVASLCDGRHRCSVSIGNAALCGDPAFLTVKQVRVDYSCGRRPRRVVIDEYKSVDIVCQ